MLATAAAESTADAAEDLGDAGADVEEGEEEAPEHDAEASSQAQLLVAFENINIYKYQCVHITRFIYLSNFDQVAIFQHNGPSVCRQFEDRRDKTTDDLMRASTVFDQQGAGPDLPTMVNAVCAKQRAYNDTLTVGDQQTQLSTVWTLRNWVGWAC